jgi:histidinol-phosphatase
MEASLDSDLAFAHDLADAADAITTARFRADDLAVDTKPDLTPVTEADRRAEQVLTELIGRARADDAVVGEEFGASGSGERRWILDPIDGTKNYVRGVPVWATLIGLEIAGELVAGVVSAPALGRRWWAAQGSGAFANGDPIRVSAVHDLADAHLCYSDTTGWDDFGLGDEFRALMRRCWRTRGFGDFWGHMLVAEGAADAMSEPILSLWDVAALIPIVVEAGGRVSDLTGSGWADQAPAVTTNGLLHDEVIDALTPAGNRG